MVEYIDLERNWLPGGNAFYPYVHKRLSFSHEQEVRAVFVRWPIKDDGFDLQAIPPQVDLEEE